MDIVFTLEKRLNADTTQAREELRRIFRDGKITLLPRPAGFYVARSEILPMVLLTLPPPAAAPTEESGEGRYPASGCAGLQLDFPAQQFQGVAEVWVPFEEAIVIGRR
ncbi:MAG TPA: hypothetical protein VGI10_01100 [Polyangiaceae bacterium]|jgi:hypothetical protein